MASALNPTVSRRSFMLGSGGLAAWASIARRARAEAIPVKEFTLQAAPARVSLVGAPHPDTDVWCYNAGTPGPEIRVRQGERIRILVENRLPEETTVHWHGVRVPNAMDGVPHLTQKPIAPGESFVYEFACPDAGTFWYHPHQRSFEQVGRGLYGPLIVEEREPVAVDRDVTWVLADWRLRDDSSISGDFGDMHDMSHDGRLGNTVTVNGRIPETFAVRAGERLRLRLANTANARIFGLEFEGHRPQIIALDGQPVEPHVPPDSRVVLGPAMRADLLLDLIGQPGQRFRVIDTFYRGLAYRVLDLVYADDPPRRDLSRALPLRLPDNPLPEPDLKQAERHQVVLGGGMMGNLRTAMLDGKRVDLRTLMHNGLVWAINGVAARGHVHEPLLTLERDRTYVLELVNDTAWHHPVHFHGHSFRVTTRNGEPTEHREWQDTVLVPRHERAEIAFVADNPGDWMIHCHILEHQAGGMMGVIRVA